MALAAHAAAEVLDDVGHAAPLTWGTHFLSAAVVGPVEVHVEPLRLGRTVSTVSVAHRPGDGFRCGGAGPVRRDLR